MQRHLSTKRAGTVRAVDELVEELHVKPSNGLG